MMSLRNLFYDVDAKIEKQTAEVISYEPVERDGGFRGSHLVAKLTTQRGDVVDQPDRAARPGDDEGLRDRVACSTECYEKNMSKIEQVIDSWTVEES